VSRDELADGWDELPGDLHHCLACVFERTLVFIDGLDFGLAFIVSEHPLDTLLIPTHGTLVVPHLILLWR